MSWEASKTEVITECSECAGCAESECIKESVESKVGGPYASADVAEEPSGASAEDCRAAASAVD